VGALTRRIQLLEVDYEQTSSRLTTATEKLDEASKHAEEAERSVAQRPFDSIVHLIPSHSTSAPPISFLLNRQATRFAVAATDRARRRDLLRSRWSQPRLTGSLYGTAAQFK